MPKYYGLTKIHPLKPELKELIPKDKINLILHPKSKGSGREWGIENFSKLIELLPESKYRIFVTGTNDEKQLIISFLLKYQNKIIDMTGKLSLTELISFINETDILVASGTGPLHIASALGKFTIGLFPPMRPIFPQRWQPIGINSHYLVIDKADCNDCRNTKDCHCIRSIKPEEVVEKIANNFCRI